MFVLSGDIQWHDQSLDESSGVVMHVSVLSIISGVYSMKKYISDNDRRDERLRALEFELKRLIERVEKLERKVK